MSIMYSVLLLFFLMSHNVMASYNFCGGFRFKDRNMKELEKLTFEAAGITSKRAGRYLTAGEVRDLTGQSDEVIQKYSLLYKSWGGKQTFVAPLKDWSWGCWNRNVTKLPSWAKEVANFWYYPLNAPSTGKSRLRKGRPKVQTPKSVVELMYGGPWNYSQICVDQSLAPNDVKIPMVVIPPWSQLFNPGLYSFNDMFDKVSLFGNFIAMLPCNIDNGIIGFNKGGTCDFVLKNEFQVIAPDDAIPYIWSQAYSVETTLEKLEKVTCGDLSTRAGMGTGYCNKIKQEIETMLNIVTDIDDDTVFFIQNVEGLSEIPKNVNVGNWNVTIGWNQGTLSGLTMQDGCGSFARPFSRGWMVTSNPKFLAEQYNFPSAWIGKRDNISVEWNGKVGKMRNGVVMAPGLAYNYIPEDVAIGLAATGEKQVKVVNGRPNGNPFLNPNNPSACRLPVEGQTSANWPFDNCGEPSLDIQMVTQLAGNAKNTESVFYGTSFNPQYAQNMPMAWNIAALTALDPMPDVVSHSWGGDEVGDGTIMLAEASMLKMASMGISVLVSSGDQGAGGDCKHGVWPQYPATSAWVTTVGASQWGKLNGKLQEFACMAPTGGLITSGGGFSTVVKRPLWQQEVVNGYLKTWTGSEAFPVKGQTKNYNPSGRGYPDLALAGWNTPVSIGEWVNPVAGTSVSSPELNGIIGQINANIRSTKGLEKERLGFLNPFLYWAAKNYPQVFNDLQFGSNRYSGQSLQAEDLDCGVGYVASKGWDAVTGFGSLNVVELEKVALKWIRLQQKARTGSK